jgi:hypothetical protein
VVLELLLLGLLLAQLRMLLLRLLMILQQRSSKPRHLRTS